MQVSFADAEIMNGFKYFIVQIICFVSVNGRSLWHSRHLKGIVGGREAAPPPVDDPIVYILKDDEYAKVYGDREGKYPNSNYRFAGIRYAEPPVGRYRFQRARKMKMKGEVSGLKFGPPCVQPHPDNPQMTVGSEDCLFLNVFTPKLPDANKGLPVLLWIHGGGFRRGSAAQYGAGFLARRDVVVVVPQYRLGSFGYLSSNDEDLPGNVALFDLAVVAEWIKDYIKFFGGDPENIVPIGQGSGGSSAMFMGISNMTQGRTKGIVAMSGSALSPSAIDDSPMSRSKVIAEESGCPSTPTRDMVRCLQELPVEKIVQVESKIESSEIEEKGVMGLGSVLTPSPVIEGENDRRFLPPYLSEEPKISLDEQRFAQVPLLTGVTKHETGGAITGGLKEQVVDKLKNVPNYLNEVVIKNLVQRQGQRLQKFAAATGETIKFLTGNYINLPTKSFADGINNLIEATSDALFNYPAYLSGDIWSKNKLPTFFYSFDHKGKLKNPISLLPGLFSSEEDSPDNKIVSHGSELPYIFDLRSLEGESDPLQNESTPLDADDQKVRDFLLDMITDFAKKKSVGPEDGKKSNSFPSFISVLPTPSFGDHFRKCQMDLWSGKKMNKPCSPLSLITDSFAKQFQNLGGSKLFKPQGNPSVLGKNNKANPSIIPGSPEGGRPSVFGPLFKQ